MEFTVLDKNFVAVTIFDSFESIIWTDRYCGAGDFEIYTPATRYLLDCIKKDYYLSYKDSEYMMIIESIEIESNTEDGNKLIIKGRSLESILDRRIIWDQTIIEGNLQNGIKKLITDAIISPTDSNRAISNFIFSESTDEAITSLTVDSAQYTGDILYDVIESLCTYNHIGFKVIPDENFNFVFSLYSGTDRSYDQSINPYVVFSQNFENIINSDYLESNQIYKTVTLVAGEGEGSNRKTAIVGEGSGLERRELFTDARDISSQTENGTLTPEQYTAQLEQRGKENLAEYVISKSFDGQVETTILFKYGIDFFLGDLVHIVDEYGNESKARITEIIRSQSNDGFDVYPTFDILDDENEEE